MKPVEFDAVNMRWAEDQPEYQTLPAHVTSEESISCWQLSWRDLLRLIFTRRIWLRQMNMNQPLQPQLMQTEDPFTEKKE
jgi:hypothetical protein